MLVRVATRRALDQLRRRYQGQAASDQLGSLVDRRPGECPDARARHKELVEQVRRGLARLPAQQAEAFWLRHLEQLRPEEVAEQMEIEPGHARVLVHRATVALRAILGPAHGPEHVSEESP
jgi:RNA polymerase sigma factor (sigma-70 family)